MGRATKFYSDVLGWNFRPVPEMQCIMISKAQSDERGMVTKVGAISGCMIKRNGPPKHPIVTLRVEDIDVLLEKVKKTGGKIVVKKTPMQMASFAYFENTECNVLGLWHLVECNSSNKALSICMGLGSGSGQVRSTSFQLIRPCGSDWQPL